MSATAPAASLDEEVPAIPCEVGRHTAPIVATLHFAHGKPRTVCIFCLAAAIQGATGFKVVNVLERMVQARIDAPAQRELAKKVRAQMAIEELKNGQ